MSKFIPPFPLKWPPGLRRCHTRRNAAFKAARETAMNNVEKELSRLGQDSDIRMGSIYITSNVAGIRATTEPADPGVAVWFDWDGELQCVAVDVYNRVEWNLQAIFRMIEADRTKIRHGGLEMIRASMRGLTLMLAAPREGGRHWREVLAPALSPGEVTLALAVSAYKALARAKGGPGQEAAMRELNIARDEAEKELGHG